MALLIFPQRISFGIRAGKKAGAEKRICYPVAIRYSAFYRFSPTRNWSTAPLYFVEARGRDVRVARKPEKATQRERNMERERERDREREK